ncbi:MULTISPECIES: hypothetical protein [Bacteroidota]|uniref:hypothetical protein n=1 Tax=Bacteroidota TaxID=976 RepID=UPI002ED884E9
MDKTVYFLGAGFSADAGGPIQNGIIQTILSKGFEEKYVDTVELSQARKEFISFLEDDLGVPESLWNAVALEDVFTPIDRCISNGKSFKKHDVKELVRIREGFHGLMGASIQFGVDRKNEKEYIDDYANYLNNIARRRLTDIKNDNIAVITTNWDILLDNSLNTLVKEFCEEEEINGGEKLAVIDYCCYISSLEDDHHIKPGLLALGKSGYNIKYLKLHGSMNWLHCPMCQRMFIKYNEKQILGKPKFCKHCKINYKFNNTNNIRLKGNLLLPTFLKDLSNIQIQLVWQNAGIELAEASKVVFIGYSLPMADFEIRQLLSRCIPKTTQVEVVLYPGSKYLNDEKERFKVFFGDRIVSDDSFILKKVPDYVTELLATSRS